jgi:hypothetical protein
MAWTVIGVEEREKIESEGCESDVEELIHGVTEDEDVAERRDRGSQQIQRGPRSGRQPRQ